MTSRKLFLKDKESYIFEDMLTSVENDANYLTVYIDNKKIITKSIFSNSLLKKKQNN